MRLRSRSSRPDGDRKPPPPLSALRSSQRYGVQFALFLPRVLELPKYKVTALVRFGRGRKERPLKLSEEDGLRLAGKTPKEWVPEELRWLVISGSPAAARGRGKSDWARPELELPPTSKIPADMANACDRNVILTASLTLNTANARAPSAPTRPRRLRPARRGHAAQRRDHRPIRAIEVRH